MEKKTYKFNLQKAEKNTFEGYASTFDNVDLQGDTVVRGAFLNSLSNHVLVLYQHDEVIGKVVDMKEDEKGLFIKAQISDTELGRDVMTLIRDGVINRMSIGFNILDYDVTAEGRILKGIELFEVSAVAFPANKEAVITGAKNYKEKKYRIYGGNLNNYLALFDDYFIENPIEKEAVIIETVKNQEQEEFYRDMQEMFDLTIEEVV